MKTKGFCSDCGIVTYLVSTSRLTPGLARRDPPGSETWSLSASPRLAWRVSVRQARLITITGEPSRPPMGVGLSVHGCPTVDQHIRVRCSNVTTLAPIMMGWRGEVLAVLPSSLRRMDNTVIALWMHELGTISWGGTHRSASPWNARTSTIRR
jgi:hypothetical protein